MALTPSMMRLAGILWLLALACCGDSFSSLVSSNDAGPMEVAVAFEPNNGKRGEAVDVTTGLEAGTDFVCQDAYFVGSEELFLGIKLVKYEVYSDCRIALRLFIDEDAGVGGCNLRFKIRETRGKDRVLTCTGGFVVEP